MRQFDLLATTGETPVGSLRPSFFEYSAHVGRQLHPWRSTYYFDIGVHGPKLGEAANLRFITIAERFGLDLPRDFRQLLTSDRLFGPEGLQIVLGIDAHKDPEVTRYKYYLVFQGACAHTVEAIRLAVGAASFPANVDPGSTYILGLDFTRRGLADLKLYFRMQADRLPGCVDNLSDFAILYRGSRLVVYQYCHLNPTRKFYFHADNHTVIARMLKAQSSAPVRTLLHRIAAMNTQLAPTGLQPWIISFAYVGRRLAPGAFTIYYHLDTPDMEPGLNLTIRR